MKSLKFSIETINSKDKDIENLRVVMDTLSDQNQILTK